MSQSQLPDLNQGHYLGLSKGVAGKVNPVSGATVDATAAAAEAGAIVDNGDAGLVEDAAGLADGHGLESGGGPGCLRCANYTPQAAHPANGSVTFRNTVPQVGLERSPLACFPQRNQPILRLLVRGLHGHWRPQHRLA